MKQKFEQSKLLISLDNNMRKRMKTNSDWKLQKIIDFTKVKTGGTPKTYVESYWKDGTVPWLNSGEIENDLISNASTLITKEGLENSSTKLIPKNSVLMALTGSTTGKVGMLTFDSCINQSIAAIIPSEKHDDDFVFYALMYSRNQILRDSVGSAQPHINKKIVENLVIFCPPLPEQEKIGKLLHNVDTLIRKTNRVIKNLQECRKSILHSLVIQGIDNNKFEKVNLGKHFLNVKIPKHWEIEKISEVLNVRKNPIDLDDDEHYTRITVKRRHEGIVLRDKVLGKDILTKNQYKVFSGDFIISRRQIVHNACGLIPNEFDGSVVSNEYSNFFGTEKLDIQYFDLFAETKLFKQMINATTQGIDVEKYIFLLDEWLSLHIPIPSIEEQKEIFRIISIFNIHIHNEEKLKKKLFQIRQGLMQNLLTGKLRIVQ